MVLDINYWAVLVAAVVNMGVGFAWYGPLFGKTWIRLAGLNYEHLEQSAKHGMGKRYLIAFIGAILTACTLAHLIPLSLFYSDAAGVSAGLMVAFWVWLGFFVPVSASAWLWEGKPAKLWLLNATYYLVALSLMGAVLAGWA